MPPRPLYYQKAVGRDIVVHEQMDLHLVWDSKRMFLKPIPRYLFVLGFWEDNFSCKAGCASASTSEHSRQTTSGTQKMAEVPICERCQMYKCALGFLLSYASLISYENDLCIAKEANLVPVELTWPDWRILIKELLTRENKRNINKRYLYGELRLARLNKVYRYTLRSPIRGYLYGHSSSSKFWQDNFTRIVSLFAYIAIVLTAMQVGLATKRLQNNDAFQRASFGFTVFSILAPLVFVGLILVVFLVLCLLNVFATLKYNRKKFEATESSCTASTA